MIDRYTRFNALKIVVGCEVAALFENKAGDALKGKGGRWVHAIVKDLSMHSFARILVTKSMWPNCKVGTEMLIPKDLLTLYIKLGNHPEGVTENEYTIHEELMAPRTQLSLF